jgi:type IV pilus assembly protein PilE
MSKKSKGFSLIELLVVIAIVAMLAAYAIPNYRQYVIKSKRTEAQNRLLEIAGMFEKHYANTNSYPDGLGSGADNLNLSTDYIEWDNYKVSSTVDNTGWVLKATAKGGQTDDTPCLEITYNNFSQKSPTECWE